MAAVPLMTYPQAIEFLYGLQLFGMKLGLENTQGLAAAMGNSSSRIAFHSRCRHERQRLDLRDA